MLGRKEGDTRHPRTPLSLAQEAWVTATPGPHHGAAGQSAASPDRPGQPGLRGVLASSPLTRGSVWLGFPQI